MFQKLVLHLQRYCKGYLSCLVQCLTFALVFMWCTSLIFDLECILVKANTTWDGVNTIFLTFKCNRPFQIGLNGTYIKDVLVRPDKIIKSSREIKNWKMYSFLKVYSKVLRWPQLLWSSSVFRLQCWLTKSISYLSLCSY